MEVYVSPKNSWNGKSYKIHYTDDDDNSTCIFISYEYTRDVLYM